MADEAMLQRVRALQMVAADERSPDGERDNARSLATKLRAKHGITDDELIQHEDVGGLFDGLFGGLRWGNSVRADVDTIWTQVDALVDRLIRDEKGLARAEAVNAVYGRLRIKLGDSTREPDEGTLKWRRDEVLTDYFLAFLARERKLYAEFEDDDADEDEETKKHWREWRTEQAYEGVAWRVRETGATLNKTTVQKIVTRVKDRRERKARWEKQKADRARLDGQPCVYCESAQPVKVPANAKSTRGEWFTYEMDQQVSVHYTGQHGEGDAFPAHTSCQIEHTKKASA